MSFRTSRSMAPHPRKPAPYGACWALAFGLLAYAQAAPAQFLPETVATMGRGSGASVDTGTEVEGTLLEGPDGALYGANVRAGVVQKGVIYKVFKDGTGFRALHVFGITPGDGAWPEASMTVGDDGALYGITHLGGTNDNGTIYKIRFDGAGYQIVFHFPAPVSYSPRGKLTVGGDGAFRGVTDSGGRGDGTIYRVNQDGTGFQVLYEFARDGRLGGFEPKDGLTRASDGRLYGVTLWGGRSLSTATGTGTIYGLNEDGSDYRMLHAFEGRTVAGGSWPRCRLLEGSDGALYGTTLLGGIDNFGTVFRINKDGSDFRVIHHESSAETSGSSRTLVETSDGFLWGASYNGVFRVDRDGGSYQQFRRYCNAYGGLILGTDRALYGVSTGPFRFDPGTGLSSELHPFSASSPLPKEQAPRAPLFRADNGKLYGSTERGGLDSNGTVFVTGPDGVGFRVINSIGTNGLTAGRTPNGLVESLNGFFYGTTQAGGSNGFGVIFRIDPDGGNYQNVHHFSSLTDGRIPRAALIPGLDGFLYGCTSAGGTRNRGTVFRIAEDDHRFSTIRHMTTADGAGPTSALVTGPDRLLYGTANGAGANVRGVLFRLDREGSRYEVLHQFGQAEDGISLQAPLIGSDGFVYGAVSGSAVGFGTIYRVRPDGTDYRVLYRLTDRVREGALPRGPLIESPPGVLWGCVSTGGVANAGAIFRARMDGTDYRVMWHFGRVTGDGSSPEGGLVLDGSGWAMGTTATGGQLGLGTVFRFDPRVIVVRLEIVGANTVLTWSTANEGDEVESATLETASQPEWLPQFSDITIVDSVATAILPADSTHRIYRIKRP